MSTPFTSPLLDLVRRDLKTGTLAEFFRNPSAENFLKLEAELVEYQNVFHTELTKVVQPKGGKS